MHEIIKSLVYLNTHFKPFCKFLYHCVAVKSREYELPKISHLLVCYVTGKYVNAVVYLCANCAYTGN